MIFNDCCFIVLKNMLFAMILVIRDNLYSTLDCCYLYTMSLVRVKSLAFMDLHCLASFWSLFHRPFLLWNIGSVHRLLIQLLTFAYTFDNMILVLLRLAG